MARLVDRLYIDYWRYAENKQYVYIDGSIARNDNTVTFNVSNAWVRLEQQTQYGSTGYTQPFGMKNAGGGTVTTGSAYWPWDYMYPGVFEKTITGFGSWSYGVSDSSTSMGLYVYAEDGDKYTSVNFPARPSVTVSSKTDTSITLAVSLAGYGDSSNASRYIEGAVMAASNTTYGAPYRFKTQTAVTSAAFAINNGSGCTGTLTIEPNTQYKYGGYASTMTDRYAMTISGTVVTLCSAPTNMTFTKSNPEWPDGNTATLQFEVERAADGGYYSRTLETSYSTDGGDTWSNYVSQGDFSGTSRSALITGLHINSSVLVRARITTTSGSSTALEQTFRTSDLPSRLYANYQSLTKESRKLYVKSPTTNLTTPVLRLYAKVDGEVTRIFGRALPSRVAQAILCDNGNLSFVYDYNTYTVGQSYTDNLGTATITAVYQVPSFTEAHFDYYTDQTTGYRVSHEYTSAPWGGYWRREKDSSTTISEVEEGREDITSVNFEQSFKSFKPTSTSGWFMYNEYIESITNAQNFNTSRVEDMSYMFQNTAYNSEQFVADLSDLNTSNVTNMEGTFYYCAYLSETYQIDISDWDTGKVTNMSYMFGETAAHATTFSIGSLSSWDVSKVTDMSYMFYYCASDEEVVFNLGDIGGWDTGSVETMDHMFYEAGSYATEYYIGDISNWNVSNVTSMYYMMLYMGGDDPNFDAGDFSGWDVSNVEDMSYMFSYYAYAVNSITLNLSSWNVSSVEDMDGMFYGFGDVCTNVSIGNISSWVTSSATSMNYTFESFCTNANYTMDLSSWNVNNVTSHNDFNLNVENKVIAPVWLNQ